MQRHWLKIADFPYPQQAGDVPIRISGKSLRFLTSVFQRAESKICIILACDIHRHGRHTIAKTDYKFVWLNGLVVSALGIRAW